MKDYSIDYEDPELWIAIMALFQHEALISFSLKWLVWHGLTSTTPSSHVYIISYTTNHFDSQYFGPVARYFSWSTNIR